MDFDPYDDGIEIIPPSRALAPVEQTTAISSHVRIEGTAFEAATLMTPWQRFEAWMRSLGENSRRAYEGDLRMFAKETGCDSVEHALEALCAVKRSAALSVVEGWRDAQVARGTASATINRRLSAVKSALRELGRADHGPGRLEVKLVRNEPRRETKGPEIASVAVAARALALRSDLAGVRDLAILYLAGQRGLRRNEMATLRVEDVDLDALSLRVLRKGKRERLTIRISSETAAALARWMEVRPTVALPHVEEVLICLQHGQNRGEHLGGQGIWCVASAKRSAKADRGGVRMASATAASRRH